jgi:hypothetical protein
MGFFGGSSKSETQIANEQIGLQGSGQVGRLQTAVGDNSTSLVDIDIGDVENARLAMEGGREIALSSLMGQQEVSFAAIEAAGRSSVAGAAAMLGASETANRALQSNTEVAGLAIDANESISSRGLELAQGVSNASYQAVIHTLGALERVQGRAIESVDRAVGSAQDIALNAAPVSPGQYAAAIADQTVGLNKSYLYAGVAAIVAVGVLIYLSRK